MNVTEYHFDPEIPLLDFEVEPLGDLYARLKKLQQNDGKKDAFVKEIRLLKEKILKTTIDLYADLDNWKLTQISRHPHRPYALDYVELIFQDFMEMHGDRYYGDDASTLCGMASLEGISVVLILQQKGKNTAEKIHRNFGMPQPEGYRKAFRLFEFAQKFNKPVITFIDTPGAYPGLAGEERSQGEAIAQNLKVMAGLKVPIISIIIGEGGSGGALGIGVANVALMLEYAIYSVISPESCASILWRNPEEKIQAALALKNDVKTAFKFGVIDQIIKEPIGGAHRGYNEAATNVKIALLKHFHAQVKKSPEEIVQERMQKYTRIGKIGTSPKPVSSIS